MPEQRARLQVTLIERDGCGLCEEAHAALTRLAKRYRVEVARVDAGEDPRYLLRVPVLAAGGSELDAAGLADGAIARWLEEVAS